MSKTSWRSYNKFEVYYPVGRLEIYWLETTVLIPAILICLSPCLVASKTDSKLQRRPRSTSMKDRQNSKAQSDRTSSIESETSPDSRLITQVCVSVCLCLPVTMIKKYWKTNLCVRVLIF